MRKFLLIITVAALLVNCTMPSSKPDDKMLDKQALLKRDTFSLLCQYWNLQDAESPTARDISFKDHNESEYKSGIIFMTDSVVLENPKGEMTYGKFSLTGNTIQVNYDDGRKAKYTIGKMNDKELLLRRTEEGRSSELTYKASNTRWDDASKNPFSKANYKWVVKPSKPESAEAIRDRAKQSVLFYTYFFEGFVNGDAQSINFDGIPSCFNWYSGGITIQSDKKLDPKWAGCFYNIEQAFQARQLLQDALLKKYDWDTTETNWVKQSAQVLKQIHSNL